MRKGFVGQALNLIIFRNSSWVVSGSVNNLILKKQYENFNLEIISLFREKASEKTNRCHKFFMLEVYVEDEKCKWKYLS